MSGLRKANHADDWDGAHVFTKYRRHTDPNDGYGQNLTKWLKFIRRERDSGCVL